DQAFQAVSTALEQTGDAHRPFRPSQNWSLAQAERELAENHLAGSDGSGKSQDEKHVAQVNIFAQGAAGNCYATAQHLIGRVVDVLRGAILAEHYKPSPTSERSFGFKLPERFQTKACLENLADWIRAEDFPADGDLRRRPRVSVPDFPLESDYVSKGKSG